MILLANIALTLPFVYSAATALIVPAAIGLTVIGGISLVGFLAYQAYLLYQDLVTKNNNLSATIVTLQGDVATLKQDLATAKQNNVDLTDQITTINEDFDAFTDTLERLEEHYQSLKKFIFDTKSEQKNFAEEIDENIAALNTALDEYKASMKQINIKSSDHTKDIDTLKQGLAGAAELLKHSDDNLTAALTDIETQLSVIADTLDEHSLALRTIKPDILDPGSLREPKTPELKKLEAQIQKLSNVIIHIAEAHKIELKSAVKSEKKAGRYMNDPYYSPTKFKSSGSDSLSATDDENTPPSSPEPHTPEKAGRAPIIDKENSHTKTLERTKAPGTPHPSVIYKDGQKHVLGSLSQNTNGAHNALEL